MHAQMGAYYFQQLKPVIFAHIKQIQYTYTIFKLSTVINYMIKNATTLFAMKTGLEVLFKSIILAHIHF